MKTFIFLCLLFTATTAVPQALRENANPLKVEWKVDLIENYNTVSGLAFLNDKVYVTETANNVGSALTICGSSGQALFTSTCYPRIRSFFAYKDGKLYSMGDQQLTIRGPSGPVLEEYNLPWKNGEYVSTLNGAILKDRVYCYAFGDFLKYTLHGDQVFIKEVAKLCSGQNLTAGGNYIYLYGQISDPPLGSHLMQYDTLGSQKWSVAPGDVRNILADANGNCYALVANGETTVIKYDQQGKVVWAKNTPGQWSRNAYLFGDSVFVCGNISPGAMMDQKQPCAFSVLSAKTGEIIYQQVITIDEDRNVFEHFSQIATDGKSVFIGGTVGNQYKKCFLLKLSKEGKTIGLQNETGARSFNIFPNPGSSRFTISCEDPGSGTLKVIMRNSLGQVIQEKELSCNGKTSWELDLGKQAAGSFSVEILSGGKKVVKQVIVE